MICSHCRDVVLDIARGLAHPDEAAALGHVRSCAACSQFLQQQRDLTIGLRALAAGADDVPSEALERRLLAVLVPRPADSSHRPRPVASRLVGGHWLKIAAAVVLAVGAMLLWQWHPRVQPTGSTRQADRVLSRVPPLPRVTPEPGGSRTAQAGPRAPTAWPETVHQPPSRSAARPARPRTVQAAGFVALPAATMLPPFERGEIVRVQIGLASLANLGFAVPPDAVDNTPVRADLLVGQDGQPRAIRLVTDIQESRSRR